MYCPNCGKTNSAGQKFCRSCGLQLEKVAQALAEQLAGSELEAGLDRRRRRLEKVIKVVGGATAAVVVGSVMWGIIYEMVLSGEILVGAVFLAFIVGLVAFALLMLYRESLLTASGKRRTALTALAQPGDTKRLPSGSQFEPAPSVTEHTTELLTVEKKGGAD
jgi:hypothetical protein